MKKRPDRITLEQDYNINCLTYKEISEKYKVNKKTVGKWINFYDLQRRGSGRRPEDLTGQKFGKLIVKERFYIDKELYWKCQCECGNTTRCKPGWLKSGNTKSCNCSHTQKQDKHFCWKGYGEIGGNFWNRFKYTAKHSYRKVEITIEDVWNKYLQQDRKCALTKLDITFKMPKDNLRQCTASIDRIDSSLDYSLDNIWLVHKDVNQLKMDLSLVDLYYWCSLVTNPIKQINTIEIMKFKSNYEGYKNITKTYWSRIIERSVQRNLEFNITMKDAWDRYEEQNGLCILTGLKINFVRDISHNSKNQTASLDRIDSKKCYTKDNIQWLHKRINVMKWDLDQNRFIELCKLITEKHFTRKNKV